MRVIQAEKRRREGLRGKMLNEGKEIEKTEWREGRNYRKLNKKKKKKEESAGRTRIINEGEKHGTGNVDLLHAFAL